MNKKIIWLILFFCKNTLAMNDNQFANTLFQVGNPSALFAGAIEGNTTYREIKQHGNFGLGTFNGIKGEMIAINGMFYQILQDGKTVPVNLDWKTPFAQVINFKPTLFADIQETENYTRLKAAISNAINNKNIPYAVKIDGKFNFITMRSRTPRSALNTKAIHENIYTANNVSGTLVGFWFPDYLMNIGAPGFHFHFISNDKKLSGHVMDISVQHAQVSIQQINDIFLLFPTTEIYKKANIIAPTLETYKKAQLK
ncbi:MAG: alpha-acetolactate decarboxylase [uncultured bacterium]|nr:MAG: alpha-acetolactate decarboxylase [uncultured bacterium]